jgi:hypothetical protein
MKLSPQTHGPVTLSKIDYAASMSEETVAFTGEISITVDGKTLKASVRNDGRGGPNCIQDHACSRAISDYAKTLPDDPTEYGSIKMSADYLISMMVANALTAKDDSKYKKKGFTHGISASHPTKGEVAFYAKGAPTVEMFKKMGVEEATAKVRTL